MTEERIPKNLQGFLKFCLQADDGTHTSDVNSEEFKEKSQWLNGVLKELSVDVGKILMDNINVLIDFMKNENQKIEDAKEALDNLMDIVENIDFANVFIKMGGLQVLKELIEFEHKLSSNCAELLAALVQNDEKSQLIAINDGFVKILLCKMSQATEGLHVKKYASGISCCIRGQVKGRQEFLEADGVSVILSSMNKGEGQGLVKCVFLLCCIAHEESSSIMDNEKFGSIVKQLEGVQSIDDPVVEHLCNLIKILLNKKKNLKREIKCTDWIKKQITLTKGKPEYQEIHDYLVEIAGFL